MKTSMKVILVAVAGFFLCVSWYMTPPIAQGARVTGEDNVISTTDEQGGGDTKPAAPVPEAMRPFTPPAPVVPQEPRRIEPSPAEDAGAPEEPAIGTVEAAPSGEEVPVSPPQEEAVTPPEEPGATEPEAGMPAPEMGQGKQDRRPAARPRTRIAAGEAALPSGTTTTPGAKKIEMPPKGAKFVTIDFDEVDIRVFIKFMSELTGKNFIIDNNVKGTVTVMSPRKISIDEAFKVFESVLEVHDFTAVPSGDVIKIVPFRSAKEKSIETLLREEAQSPEDKVVTQIIPLKFADPEEMKKILTPLMSKSSIALSYTPTGMLIITDLLSNIERLMIIIQALDVEGVEEQIAVLPLQYANAAEIAKSLTQIFQKGAGQAKKETIQGGVKIIPDDRTNSLVILASENTRVRIKELIALLDKEVPRGEAKIRVYRLQNAQADELAKVLAGIPTSKDSKGGTAPAAEVPALSKDVKIVPDKATNTLVITASRDDYNVLEEVIKQLDVPRPMVYIEALIMEVNVNKDFRLGVNWMGGEDFTFNDRQALYGGGFTGGNILPSVSSTGAVTLPTGLAVGVIGEAITIGGVTFPSLSAVLQAYKKDEDVNILSTPQIMTLDNNEAEIQVGENVPYLTRQETSTTDRDYSTYEYKDVGVTLRLTPQISQERFVKLAIFQEVTKLVSQSDVRPTTLKRTTKTTVTIKDANTVVIGGLIGDDVSDTEYKIPLLGDIPILGWLFKYKTDIRGRRNLFIFITPHIVESPVEAKAIFEEKREHMDSLEEGVIRRYQWNRDAAKEEGANPE
ncbi:MAG: type II secretion system secretin GspD [Deltaproteobacteria bacterium]|nr:type II secretion system secretin GspD [Deltaproteobacteria bacterium]